MSRVLVCGGRDYDDGDHIWNTLCAIDAERRIDVVIHGCATGADTEGMDIIYMTKLSCVLHSFC